MLADAAHEPFTAGVGSGALPPLSGPRARSAANRRQRRGVGRTKGLACLPDGIPITGVAGDQQAALFGQACFEEGEAKCTYGTGAFALMNIGERPILSRHGLVTTVAWRVQERTTYALEGSAFIAGAAVQWLRDGLGLVKSASEIESLARTVASSDGVVFVPHSPDLGASLGVRRARAHRRHHARHDSGPPCPRDPRRDRVSGAGSTPRDGTGREANHHASACRRGRRRQRSSDAVSGGRGRDSRSTVPSTSSRRTRRSHARGSRRGLCTPEATRRMLRVAKRFEPTMDQRARSASREMAGRIRRTRTGA